MRFFATLLFLLAPLTAHAWSEAGHKTTASIAFRQLSKPQQAKIVAILKHHPRYAEDFAGKMLPNLTEAEQNEWHFQQAAVWPDMARAFKGEDRKLYHKSPWHYINIPHYLTEEDKAREIKANRELDPPEVEQEEMNIVQTMRLARKLLADPATDDAKKAVMLCWLFHCIGDIHQPLHSTALFCEAFPDGDRGGNSIDTVQKKNLHALWDQFIGNRAAYRTARNRAIKLISERSALGSNSVRVMDDKAWLDESHEICVTVVYDPEIMGWVRGYTKDITPLKLTEEYLKTGGGVAERRIVQAGYRLGSVLKEVSNN